MCLVVICFPGLAVSQQAGSQSGTDLSTSGLQTPAGLPSSGKTTARPLTPEMRGDIYMARKMYREAIDVYRESPPSAASYNKIGIAFHEMRQLGLAKKNYQQALKLDRSFAEAINNLGTVYYAEGSYKKAIVYYKRSLRTAGANACIYVNLGAAYFARHDYNHSSEYYEQAFRIDPDVFERRGLFGTLMQQRSDTDLALFHLYLAKAYAKRGADERALLYLRKAMEEGLKDRKKLPDMPEFSALKQEPEFQQLLAEDPRPL
jgi:tetratricopeptide (TPR) repeat protein